MIPKTVIKKIDGVRKNSSGKEVRSKRNTT
jgi:hypothetical protein